MAARWRINTFTAPFVEGNTRITEDKNIDCGIRYTIYIYKICTDNFLCAENRKGRSRSNLWGHAEQFKDIKILFMKITDTDYSIDTFFVQAAP
jgi:hypothetical protein